MRISQVLIKWQSNVNGCLLSCSIQDAVRDWLQWSGAFNFFKLNLKEAGYTILQASRKQDISFLQGRQYSIFQRWASRKLSKKQQQKNIPFQKTSVFVPKNICIKRQTSKNDGCNILTFLWCFGYITFSLRQSIMHWTFYYVTLKRKTIYTCISIWN